ncbi:MAG: class I SAM-dependent methyltransferase [Bryobacteraceae bacterium]
MWPPADFRANPAYRLSRRAELETARPLLYWAETNGRGMRVTAAAAAMTLEESRNSKSGVDFTGVYRTGAYCEQNPDLHAGDSPWKVRQILEMLQRHGLRPMTVCDVGCGAGHILRLLQPHLPPEAALRGYDISPPAIQLSRQFENDRLRFSCQDYLSDDFGTSDLLLCIDVLEHVPDYLGFLAQLRTRATLKIFHIPLEMCARSALCSRSILRNRAETGHLHYFNLDTALVTLRDTGYKVIDSFYTPSFRLSLNTAGRKERLLRTLFRVTSRDFEARVLGGYSLLALAE